MFQSILVPLDRSPLAEQALPLALGIARRAQARLDLVMVHQVYALEDPHYGRVPFDPVLDQQWKQEEQLYLDATAKWLTAGLSVPVSTSLVVNLVTDGILERVKDRKSGLIVMTTHGRGPVSRFFLGSVADAMIRLAPVPVLLVRPSAAAPSEPSIENVIILLDGSPLAEQVLGPAGGLAALMEANCTLLRVVESDNASRAAREYLERIAAGLRGQGLQVQAKVAVAEHATETVLQEVKENDLIALATHGRGGIRRLLLGSTADKVIRSTTAPVLVCRPPES